MLETVRESLPMLKLSKHHKRISGAAAGSKKKNKTKFLGKYILILNESTDFKVTEDE